MNKSSDRFSAKKKYSDRFVGDLDVLIRNADDVCRERIEDLLDELARYKLPLNEFTSEVPEDPNERLQYLQHLRDAVHTLPSALERQADKLTYVRNWMKTVYKQND